MTSYDCLRFYFSGLLYRKTQEMAYLSQNLHFPKTASPYACIKFCQERVLQEISHFLDLSLWHRHCAYVKIPQKYALR